MQKIIALFILFFSTAHPSYAQEVQDPAYPTILSMKDRAELRDAWLIERLDTIVPMLMRREKIDMWVLIAREYNEDPVVETMLPATWLAARRRTILVFYDNGKTVERFAVSRYAVGDIFKSEWNPERQPDQWRRAAELIKARDPKKIAVNYSSHFALADGITHTQFSDLKAALPAKYQSRIKSAEKLAIGWLETRTASEMKKYGEIVRIAHAIIAQGMSEHVITTGITTPDDVVWWFRDRIRSLGLITWFHPSVSIQRAHKDDKGHASNFEGKKTDPIEKGDLLHIDFGIKYLGLNTDTQHHTYVLKDGETQAPKGLRDGLKAANRIQDILTSYYKVGRSGNDVLKRSLRKAKNEGLKPIIYTHPIGLHGHAAGSTIGLWDQQGGVAVNGNYPVQAGTAWSIELSAVHKVAEWGGQDVRFMTEEDAFFDGKKVRYIDGRQTEFHLIPRQ